ncbi:transcription factor [Candidatus Bathyarchaeota archaeon]|nr:MAG: transcription factor [Candidatus Bathyarchaeota archaeon]TMI31243.1 MAG: transcription factor [Candidatus Bathyarchaeota archaeon]
MANHDDLARLASFFGGEEAINVVKALAQAGTTTDDVIATQANVRLNTARRILYKLYDHALVTCTRSRDETTGWFIYHWKLQPDQLDTFVRSRKKKTLEKIRTRLDYEKDHSFFMCKACLTIRVTFEDAMESAFRCSGCNGQLISEDNSKTIQVLEESARRLESELSEQQFGNGKF